MFVSPASEVDLLLHATMIEPNPIELTPRYNIAPTDPVLAVTSDRIASWFRWGLVPSWAKDPRIGTKMINARWETAHERPAYRTALMRRRCAIPANGFYEWREEGQIELVGLFDDPKTTYVKQPYLFEFEEGKMFAFAGLWDSWVSPDGSELRSLTILTTAPNEYMEPYHDRMPCILPERRIDEWLDQKNEHAHAALVPVKPEPLYGRKVSRNVGRPGIDGVELLQA